MNQPACRLSIVIPVRNSPAQLAECLDCLGESTFRDYEVIVVDDASTDNTRAVVAGRKGIQCVPLTQNLGPAGARNRGVEHAQGEIILFLDADVLAQPETVGAVVEAFAQQPEMAALFGSYDDAPRVENLISQYRNLLHHFTHQVAARQASTFWAGCGAVRRAIYVQAGGFDTDYRRPCIEDIEFGVRLRKAGLQIRLHPEIQVKHLKRWTMWGMVRTDFRDRALPWTELMLREGPLLNDLNVQASQRLCVILAFALGAVWLGAAWWFHPALLLLPVAVLAGIWAVDHWPPSPRAKLAVRVVATFLTAAALTVATLTMGWWTLLPLALGFSIVGLNWPFYRFLAGRKGALFAAAAFPLHGLYFVYSGVAFGIGWLRHQWRRGRQKTVGATELA